MNTKPQLTRSQLAAQSLNVPRGVRGDQRAAYLALTDEQKAVYRRHFYIAGRYAAHCLRYALQGVDVDTRD